MKRLLTILLTIAAVGVAAMMTAPPRLHVLAQNRMSYSIVGQNSGHVALGLALRKLGVYGAFMQAPAHPDDENNALLAMFAHGMGLRSIDVQNNRGDGGQNEIGPELFRDMAVLRTAELLSAHRIDGAEQYFTRAIDYGYSFDPQEVIGKWGREDIVGDYVRLLRTLRPDVVLTMNIQGRGGDRAHEATTILVREAYYAAGDPSKYPAQLREGLRPWQPKKLYFTAPPAPAGAGRGAAGRGLGDNSLQTPPPVSATNPPVKLTQVNTSVYDSLLGRTYTEIGADARSNHKCQGVSGLPPLPGFNNGRGGDANAGPAGGAGANQTGAGRGGAGRGSRQSGAGQTNARPADAASVATGPAGGGYQLIETTIPGQKEKTETTLFDGVDTRLEAIAQYAGGNPPAALISGIAAIATDAKEAQKAFDSGDDSGTAQPIEAGLSAIRALRAQLANMGLDESARYEIDYRLRIKERDYEDAVLATHGLTFDAVADDGLVIGGQSVRLSILAVNHGPSDVGVIGVSVVGFDEPAACAPGAVKKDSVYTCSSEARVPQNAPPTTPYFSDNYWKHPETQAIQIFAPDVEFGVPFAPTPFRVTFHIQAGGVEVTKEMPIEFRYIKDIYLGDKRMELSVVPAFSVGVTPSLAVIPASGGVTSAPVKREMHVSIVNDVKGATEASVSLELPQGWKAVPASAPLSFTHEDEALSARFEVTAPTQARVGQYTLRAVVVSSAFPNQKFSDGYQVIEYPHIQRRQVIKPAEVVLKVVDVKGTPDINVGYIVGVGDQVPPAIEQLGAKVSYIDADELAWGDLSRHDVIVTGVRAYERRADLRGYNRRLLDYVQRGGTVIVQYNKMEFNQADYGPYPAKVSGNRVADELVPVKILAPANPVFNFPNKIGPSTWAGWVQERGLYFLGEKDPKYVDLLSITDSFRDNPGEKLGSMVEAKYGKGTWIYLGLGLWRQLPAGTDGAYRLLANLISLSKARP
jgi:LmbE family N-acetylglucosaminyl deacetylase